LTKPWHVRFLVYAFDVQSDKGRRSAAQLTKQKHFQRSLELSEGDVRLPKLFRQIVPQSSPGPGWQVLIELVA